LQASKRYARRTHTFGDLTGYWSALRGVTFDAYEIHHGRTSGTEKEAEHAHLRPALPDGCAWQHRDVLALYTHGIFENAAVLRALFGQHAPSLDDTLDGLADFIDEHIGARALTALLGWSQSIASF
jgi:adenosylcobyric acid synthase